MNTINNIEKTNVLAIKSGNKRVFNYILRVGVLSIVVLGGIYISLINTLATKGFELEELKNERFSIQKQLEKVDIATTIPTSIYALQSLEIVQEMATVKGYNFLTVSEGQVAMN